MPKAPSLRRPSTTCGGYSPVSSIATGSTSVAQELPEGVVEGGELGPLPVVEGERVDQVERGSCRGRAPAGSSALPLRLARGLGDLARILLADIGTGVVWAEVFIGVSLGGNPAGPLSAVHFRSAA